MSDSSTFSDGPGVDQTTYRALRHVARRLMDSERGSHTLQPTALVNEAWLRLARVAPEGPDRRSQLLALASLAMRRVLLDHARRRGARKRGGEGSAVAQDPAQWADPDDRSLESALTGALEGLRDLDPLLARVVELRFLQGLELTEVARELGLSVATVKRRWALARGWLHRELSSQGALDP